MREAFAAYLQCGVLAHGCARLECTNKECKHSELLAFSCKKRFCPSCDAKRAVLFAENLVENVLLPFEHRHLVFTVPKRLRSFFKFDRSNLGLLYTAAWESWKSLLLEKHPDASPADGLVLPDGSVVKVELDSAKLIKHFADLVLEALLKLDLITQDVVDNMNSWEHSGFSVHIGNVIPYSDIA